MTINSKNLFNSCVFTNKIFTNFKNYIFEDLHTMYEINFNKTIQKLYIENFVDVFNKYKQIYLSIKKEIKINNKIIYKWIITNYKNIIVNSINFSTYFNKIKLQVKNKVYLDGKYDYYLLDDIIQNILISFYYKTFFSIKSDMLNKIKINKKYEQTIKDIKNNIQMSKSQNNSDYKNKITKIFNDYCNEKINELSDKEKTENEIKAIKSKYSIKSEKFSFKKCVYLNLGRCKEVIPADTILNGIDDYSSIIETYYKTLQKGIKCNKPKYKGSKDKNHLLFYTSTFKIIKNKLRISLGKYTNKYYNSSKKYIKYKNNLYFKRANLCKKKNKKYKYVKYKNKYVNKKHLIKSQYMYIHLPFKLLNLTYCEIVSHGNVYKLNVVDKLNDKVKILDENINEKDSISIDLGLVNLMTIYNPSGKQKIIKGGKIKSINNFYNLKIDKLKSINKKNYGNMQFNRLYSLLNERKNKINGYFNRIIDRLSKMYNNKKYFIIGYNKGWKNKISLRKKTNRQFYEIPFNNLLLKMKSQLNRRGINVILTEESYTSKCDALMLENFDEIVPNKKRIKRGLFYSSTGKKINADLNGAINIMRKKIKLDKINGKNIMNPELIQV
jgi:putative transposase